jgi:hypothetical protein
MRADALLVQSEDTLRINVRWTVFRIICLAIQPIGDALPDILDWLRRQPALRPFEALALGCAEVLDGEPERGTDLGPAFVRGLIHAPEHVRLECIYFGDAVGDD